MNAADFTGTDLGAIFEELRERIRENT